MKVFSLANQGWQRCKRFFRIHLYLFKKRYTIIYRLSIGIVSGLCLIILFVLGLVISVYFEAFGPIPKYEDIKNVQNHEATEILSKNGRVLGSLYIENRLNADMDEIPKDMLNALVATEDERFFEHKGIDLRALLRVITKTILLGDRGSGGGSTLSQQLVKNIYKREDHGVLTIPVTKIKEMIVARRFEKVYTKEELIKMYLNTVPFGRNTYGVKVAADRYFNTSVQDLKVEEIAVLIGMLKANTTYDPISNPERSKARRNIVLDQMEKNAYLPPEKLDSLQALPLVVDAMDFLEQNEKALYFKDHVQTKAKKLITLYNKKHKTQYDLLKDGLKIYTTLDSRLQNYAESSVKEHMVNLQSQFDADQKSRSGLSKSMLLNYMRKTQRYKESIEDGLSDKEAIQAFDQKIDFSYYSPTKGKYIKVKRSPKDSLIRALTSLQCGLVALDPSSGGIRAWVGGIDYKSSQYDHVLSKRQVGSTFKPVVYLSALQQGIDPCEYMPNEPTIYSDYEDWSPQNADGEYGGYYSMKGALSNSINTIAVDYIFKAGISNVVQLAKDMGIDSEIVANPTLALGTLEASVAQMAELYGCIANEGAHVEPYVIEKIEDAEGKVLFQRKKREKIQVLNKEDALLMRSMLTQVINKGTAQRARSKYGLQRSYAGKTGTTTDQTDGWFVGFSTNLVCSVWVGADDARLHWNSLVYGQGANTALPIWSKMMRRMEGSSLRSEYSPGSFEDLDSLNLARIDCMDFRESLEDPRFLFDSLPIPWFWNQEKQLERNQRKLDKKREKQARRNEDYKAQKKFFDDLFKKKKKKKRREQ